MAKYSNVVEYNVVTNVDTSGIVKLQNELTKLKQSLKFDNGGFNQLGFDDAKIEKSIQKINQLQNAITAAFNPKIGTIDLSKLNTSLQREHTSLQMIVKDWEQMGTRGTMAISNLSNALLSMNKGALNVNTTLSKIANTFGNTVRWGITASIFQEMMSSVQGAVSYMKDLDESLTQIQMVTNSSKEDMRELAQYANNAAQALGSTTTDYTNAVKVFVQEGFSESESKQYANLSTKLANVSEQNTATTSDQITAYRNAFQLDYEQTVAAMDKVANVANNTASNVNELMTASQRSASVANAVNASQDSFLASIATIESVTRQSAEEIGNGLKTIYQRMADIKVSGKTDDGVDYGQYAATLKEVGVDILDANREIKSFDQILTELQAVWGGLSETMKQAVGQKVAGKFQYNRFVALMDNPEYYQKAYNATQGASGMMDQMNEHYMESIEGRLNTLQAAGEQVMSTLFNQDAVEPVIEDVTHLVNGLNDLVEAMGGLNGVLPAISALMLRTFSTPIAGTITNMATSIGTIVANSRNANQLQTTANLVGLSNYTQSKDSSSITGKLVSGVADNYDQLSVKTQERIRDLSQQIVELEEQKTGVLKEQEFFFKQIGERAIEEKNAIQQQVTEYTKEIKLIGEKAKAGKASTEEIEKSFQLEEKIKNELSKKLKIYTEISKEVANYANKIATGAGVDEKMITRLQEMRREASGLGINIAELESLIEKLGVASNNLKIGEKMVEATVSTVNLEANINNMIKGLSGLTSVAFGISMISETFKVLDDETASLKEKLDAIAINGLMGITMLVPGIMQSVSAVRELGKAWEIWRTQQAAALAITELSNVQEGIRIGLKKDIIKQCAVESLEQGKLNKEKMAELLALNGYKPAAAKALATKTANLAIDEASEKVTTRQIVVTTLRTKATEILTAALIKLGFAEDFVKVHAGAIGIALIAVTAIATAAFAAVNQMAEAEEKRKQQLEEQINTSNEIVQKLNETKSAYDEVYNSYKQTGEASEDLKNKSLELAEALKIEGAEALANTGRYDELNEKIQQAAINQREYNNALLEQQGEDLNKQNSTYYYNWQDMAYGADGSLVGTGPTPASVTSGEERIKTKKSAIETAEKEIAAAREQLALLDNTKDGYIEEKAALEELIKTKQTYITQNALTENEEKQVEVYKGAAENTANIFKDSGLFDNITNYQEVIDELQSNENIKKYLSFLGEEEARAWIQAYTQEILAGKTDILEAYQEAIANENAAFDAYNTGMVYGDDDTSLQEQLKSLDINSVEDFSKAIKNGTINIEGFAESVELLTSATEDLTTNINGNEFTNRIDISSDEEKFKDFLEDSGMSEGAFNRMSRDAYEEEGGYYQTNKEDLEKNIEGQKKFIATLKEGDEALEEEQKKLAGMQSELEDLDDAAKDTTAAILRMSNGVVKLRNKIGDISEILTNDALKGTTEWYEALNDLDEGLSEVLNIDAGTLSDTFIESGDALAYAQRMAEGDMSAIDDLRTAAARDIIQNLSIQLKKGEDIDAVRSQLLNELSQLQAEIDAGTITVTTDLDDKPFIQKLNMMLADSQISAEQASNILSSIGMDAKIQYAEGEGTVDAVEYEVSVDHPVGPMPDGTQMPPRIRMIPHMVPVKTTTRIPYLQGAHYTGSGVQTANTAARNPSYTGGYSKNPTPKNSNGSSPKSSTPKQKTIDPEDKQKNEWDYLTDITNDLDRASAAMEKLTKLEDRLFGKDRISNLKKMQSEYKGYIKLLQKEVNLAKKHVKNQQRNTYDENGNLTLNGFAGRAGLGSVSFDSKGNIQNGKAIEAALTQKVNDAINQYNGAVRGGAEDTTWYKKNIELAQKDHDDFMKAVSDYESSLKTIEDGQNQIQEYNEKIQAMADKIVDSIQEGIDEVVEAMDSQRKFDKMSRDWKEGGSGYSHFDSDRKYYSEGLSNLLSPKVGGRSVLDAEIKNLNKRIKDAEKVYDIDKKDSKDADKEKLTQADAQENLREATDKVVNTLETIVGYYDSLLNTISEASAKMDELVNNNLANYDRIEDILDSRLNQIKLLFGNDYGSQVKIYNQKIATNMSKMTAINDAIKAKQISVEQFERLEADHKKLTTEERKELVEARQQINKLQQEQIDTETSLLQDIASKLEAQVRAQTDEMVNSFFGGKDVEWLSQQWEIATRNSEQYLDDYNRAFEIQKLQLKYQDLLNDAQGTEIGIQQRISKHMKEQLDYLKTKRDASKENLAISKYDVEYAEKQLDILQRQIALENAQNDKSQMRLQRNAAGNYDFVYGADEDATNQAMQALLNAQQEAYNLSKQMFLDTYNNAVQTAQKTKEMIVEIATDASLSFDEKTTRIQFILDNLKQYMNNSSVELKGMAVNLYNDFIEADALIAQENLGKLQGIYSEIQLLSSTTLDSMKQKVLETTVGEDGTNKAWELFSNSAMGAFATIDQGAGDLFGEEGTLKEFFSTVLANSDTTWEDIGENLKQDKLPKINSYVKEAFIEGSSGESIVQIVSSALSNVDTRFEETETNTGKTMTNIDEIVGKTFDAISGNNGYLRQYESVNNEVLASVDTTYTNFIEDSLKPAKEETAYLDENTKNLKEDMDYLNTVIKNSTNALVGVEGKGGWNKAIQTAIDKAGKFVKKANAMDEALGEITYSAASTADELERIAALSDIDVSVDYTTTYTTYHNDVYTTTYSDGGGYNYNTGYAEPTYSNNVSSSNNYGSNDYSPTHYSVNGFGGGIMFRTTSYAAAEEYKRKHSRPGMPLTINVGQWDTGGYTGTWTDMGMDEKKGKLAILHQKELVLNADDTKNMLSAVSVVRDIMSNINKLPSLGNNITSTASNSNVEQRVEISASFPGVTTALEIERALTELADNAYQYANRYKY